MKISKKFKNSERTESYSSSNKGKQSGSNENRRCGCGHTKSSWRQDNCNCGCQAGDWEKKSWKWGKCGGEVCAQGPAPKKWTKKRKVKGRKFVVTIVNKGGHPWEQRITSGNQCFAVDGVRGQTLHLNRGSTYVFTLNQQAVQGASLHYFYLTTDPQGGKTNGYNAPQLNSSTGPISSGSMVITVDNSYPPVFYYQSSNSASSMGGLCIVHDQK